MSAPEQVTIFHYAISSFDGQTVLYDACGYGVPDPSRVSRSEFGQGEVRGSIKQTVTQFLSELLSAPRPRRMVEHRPVLMELAREEA